MNSYRSNRTASSLTNSRSREFSQQSPLKPRHYPLQYVDVVVPKFIKLVGDPKTKEVTLESVKRALDANRAVYDHDVLANMFEEADVKKDGFLTSQAVFAAATGRYYKFRKYMMADWVHLIAAVLNVPVHRMDPAMDLVANKSSLMQITGDGHNDIGAESSVGDDLPSISSRSRYGSSRQTQSYSSTGVSRLREPLPQIAAASFQQSREMQMTRNTHGDEKLIKSISLAADQINAVTMNEGGNANVQFGGMTRYKQHEVAPTTKQELDATARAQFEEYLAALEKAYGHSVIKTIKSRPNVVTHKGFENRTARTSVTKQSSNLPAKWQPNPSPPISLAPLRTRATARSKAQVKNFRRTDRLVTIHDYDYYKTLGEQLHVTPMAQTLPKRPGKTQIGLPQADLYHISSFVPPPAIFGSAEWWN